MLPISAAGILINWYLYLQTTYQQEHDISLNENIGNIHGVMKSYSF